MTTVRAIGCTVLLLLAGCTSVQVYGLDEVGANLPLDVGDEVKIFLVAEPADAIELRVTALSSESLKGVSDPDIEAELEFDWNEISRLETRQADAGKTTWLVGILLLLGVAAIEAGEDIRETFENLFGQGD